MTKCYDCGIEVSEVKPSTGKPYTRCSKHRKKASDHHARNRDKSRARSKAWYINNLERASEYNKDKRKLLRSAFLQLYGGMCVCCQESQPEFLTLDHVQNDGAQDRLQRSKDLIYKDAIKLYQPDRYQILCWNCNLAKALYGECPHVHILH